MKPRKSFIFSLALSIILSAVSRAQREAVPGNRKPPFLSVYRWDIDGLRKGELESYSAWLNRKSVWPQSHQPKDTWDNIRGADWQLGPWGEWIAKNPGTRLTLSVSILAGPWDRTGPTAGIDAGRPVSLERGAKGEYNEHFRVLAKNLVSHGLGESILRPGWEFNGGWMTWRVTNPQEAEAFAGYWRQIVTTMRAVPGAEKLHFCWNPNIGWQSHPPDKSWPGDDYVDSVGLDYYDEAYEKETYPWPGGASEDEIEARRKKAWEFYYNCPFGLGWLKKFGKEHHKPIAIPEWGTNIKSDGHGGLDNPGYIERMHGFISNPDNNVYFHCYFDVNAPDGHHQLSPGVENKPTGFPKAAARFRELFGLPAKAKTTGPSR